MTDTNTNNKKTVPSKAHPKVTATLKQALLEFQKLATSASKGGQGGIRTYARLEDVIEAVGQGNQFGLFFTQEIDYVYTSHMDTKSEVVVVTTLRHVVDDATYVSKLPIIMSQQNMGNPQKIGSAITYAKRYTLQAVYGLPSEDDDGELASKPTIQVSKPKMKGEDDGLW